MILTRHSFENIKKNKLKHTLFYLFLFTLNTLFSQNFTFKNIQLLHQWNDSSLPVNNSQVRYSDCLGFVYKSKEYALIGTTLGTEIFELSTNQLINKGTLLAKYRNTNAYHRDFAVYKDYLYIVGDEGNNTLQIFDLSVLPAQKPVLLKEDSLQFGRVHTLFIDTINALLYSCIHRVNKGSAIAAPLKVFSISDPLNPVELYAGPQGVVEVHEVYVRNGKAFLNCGFDGLRYYDFSNPSQPKLLDQVSQYADQGYNHQGWLSPSGNTYLFADETSGKRVKKCSIQGDNIKIEALFGTNFQNESVPHNIMCTDTFAYVAYYNEGLRIYDLRYPTPIEIAYFDTHPIESKSNMQGNWGIYSALPSGKLIASDRVFGLFILQFNPKLFTYSTSAQTSLFPNLINQGEPVTFQADYETQSLSVQVYALNGQLIQSESFHNVSTTQFRINVTKGMYYVALTKTDGTNQQSTELIRITVI